MIEGRWWSRLRPLLWLSAIMRISPSLLSCGLEIYRKLRLKPLNWSPPFIDRCLNSFLWNLLCSHTLCLCFSPLVFTKTTMEVVIDQMKTEVQWKNNMPFVLFFSVRSIWTDPFYCSPIRPNCFFISSRIMGTSDLILHKFKSLVLSLRVLV